MKTISLDLRERILASIDAGEGTREDIARRFRVSLGMVKKLIQQRKRIGSIANLHHRAGRKPMILEHHRTKLVDLLRLQPDLTLAELRTAIGLNCSLPAIHHALADLNLTYKKRHSAPASRTVLT